VAKKKVKRAKPKVSKDININIKNIMSQIQNQPKRDYIKPQKRIPKDSFNTGESYRAFAPAVTYASNPIQAFQGIAPIANPPATRQLTSMPAVYKSEPILPAEANAYDIKPKEQPAPFRTPQPSPAPSSAPSPRLPRAMSLRDLSSPDAAISIEEALRRPSSFMPSRSQAGAIEPRINPERLGLIAAPTQVSTPINQPYASRANILEMMRRPNVAASSARFMESLPQSSDSPNIERIRARFAQVNQ